MYTIEFIIYPLNSRGQLEVVSFIDENLFPILVQFFVLGLINWFISDQSFPSCLLGLMYS